MLFRSACISFFGNVITNLQAVLRSPQDIDPAGFALLGVNQIACVGRRIIENAPQVFKRDDCSRPAGQNRYEAIVEQVASCPVILMRG